MSEPITVNKSLIAPNTGGIAGAWGNCRAEYVRRCIIDRLKADGVNLQPAIDGVA